MEIQKREFGLQELVAYKQQVEVELKDRGEDVPDDILQTAEVAEQLLAGKIDQAARFRAGLIAGIEASRSQTEYLENLLETTERLMKEAVVASGKPRLEGTTYSLRVQNNSRASTIIEDESKIPDAMKNMTMVLSDRYDPEKYYLWASIVLSREVDPSNLTETEREILDKSLAVSVSKTLVESALKKDPSSVPGARMERGTHLRVDAGKVKPRLEQL